MKSNPTYHSLLFLSILFYQAQMHSQWTAQTPPTDLNLEAIHFFDSNIGLTSGSYTLMYKTTDGGISWTSIGNYPARDLSFANATSGYAVSITGEPIKKTTNGGTGWFSNNTTNFRLLSWGFCSFSNISFFYKY